MTLLASKLAMGIGDDSVKSIILSGVIFLVLMVTAVWRSLNNYEEKKLTVWISAIVPMLCSILAVLLTDGPALKGLIVGFLCSSVVPLVLWWKLRKEYGSAG